MLSIAAVLATLTVTIAAPAVNTQSDRPTIAVVRFADRGSYGLAQEDLEALQVGLQEMLMTELELNRFVQVVDRARVGRLGPADPQDPIGNTAVASAVRVGAEVGATYVVLGSFVDLHGDFRIDVRIVNVANGTVIRTERVLQNRDSIYAMVVELAGGVTRSLNVPGLSRQSFDARRSRPIPPEAVRLYAKGLLYGERGDVERARGLLEQAKQLFPDYREVDGALRRLRQ